MPILRLSESIGIAAWVCAAANETPNAHLPQLFTLRLGKGEGEGGRRECFGCTHGEALGKS